jgi:hypothetical protein
MVHLIRVKASMSVDEHLSRTRAGRKMLVAEKQCAKDVAEVIQSERWWGQYSGEGPSIPVLLAAWRKSRDSWLRVAKSLALDSALRDAMFEELAKREASMNAIAQQAEALVKRMGVNGHA